MLRHFDAKMGKGLFDDPKDRSFRRMLAALSDELEDMRTVFGSAQNVNISLPATTTGLDNDLLLSLQELLAPLRNPGVFDLVPSNLVAFFSGTLAQARSLQGWEVLDGTGNIPDLRNKFVRGANEEPGGNANTSTHTHDTHPDHKHAGTVDACNGICCACAGVIGVSPFNHVHTFTTGIQVADDGSTPLDLDHSSASHIPPYYDLIPIRKR